MCVYDGYGKQQKHYTECENHGTRFHVIFIKVILYETGRTSVMMLNKCSEPKLYFGHSLCF